MSPRVLVLYASQTAEVLTKLGLKVTEASSFVDAQHLLSQEEQFDAVVISDQLIGCAPEERKALYTAATLTTPAVLLGTCFAGPVSALLPDNPLAQYPIVGVEPGVSYGQLLTILSVTAPRTDPVLLAETVRPGPLAEFQMVPSEQPVIGYKRVYLLRENSQWLVAGGFSGAVVPMRTAALCWCAEEGKSHEPGTTYPGVCSGGFSAHLDPVAAWNRQDSALLPLATVGASGRVMLAAGPYYGYDTLSSYQRVISIEVNGLCHACYLAEESAYSLATHLELIAEPSEFGDALRARPTCGNHHLPTVELGQASRELADLGVELVVRDNSRSVEAFALHKEQKRTRQERVARRQRSLRQYQFEDLAVAMRRYLASHKSVQ